MEKSFKLYFGSHNYYIFFIFNKSFLIKRLNRSRNHFHKIIIRIDRWTIRTRTLLGTSLQNWLDSAFVPSKHIATLGTRRFATGERNKSELAISIGASAIGMRTQQNPGRGYDNRPFARQTLPLLFLLLSHETWRIIKFS